MHTQTFILDRRTHYIRRTQPRGDNTREEKTHKTLRHSKTHTLKDNPLLKLRTTLELLELYTQK